MQNNLKSNKFFVVDDINQAPEKIKEALIELGFQRLPDSIAMDGTNQRWDGAFNGAEKKAGEKGDWYKATIEPNGNISVAYQSWYGHTKGYFYINIKKPLTVQNNPYLKRKGCNFVPGGLSTFMSKDGKEILAIDIRDYITNDIISKQYIQEGSTKQFKKGTSPIGGYLPVYDKPDWQSAPLVFIAEGLATAISVHEASGLPCLVGFGISNIPHLLTAIAQHTPDLMPKLVWAADTDKPGKDINVSKMLAEAAKHPIRYVLPTFKEEDSGTDFNDLMALYGLEPTKEQLRNIKKPPMAAPVTVQETVAKKRAEPMFLLPGLDMSKLYFSQADDAYIDPSNGRSYPRHISQAVSHEKWRDTFGVARYIKNTLYAPGLSPLGLTYDEKGTPSFNLYTPPKYGTPDIAGAKRLLELTIRAVDERTKEILLNWFMYILKHPGKLLVCHPLLASAEQGTGKGEFMLVVIAALGQNNVAEMTGRQPLSRFEQAAFCKKQLIRWDECDPRVWADETLLTYSTAPMVSYEEKYQKRQLSAPRTANIICATNKVEYLSDIADARRVLICLWTNNKLEDSGDYPEIAALRADPQVISGLKKISESFEFTIDVENLSKYRAPPITWHQMSDCPIQVFMDNVEIDQYAFVGSTQFKEALLASPSYRRISADNIMSDDKLSKQISDAFAKRKWQKARKRINGLICNAYINPDSAAHYNGPITIGPKIDKDQSIKSETPTRQVDGALNEVEITMKNMGIFDQTSLTSTDLHLHWQAISCALDHIEEKTVKDYMWQLLRKYGWEYNKDRSIFLKT